MGVRPVVIYSQRFTSRCWIIQAEVPRQDALLCGFRPVAQMFVVPPNRSLAGAIFARSIGLLAILVWVSAYEPGSPHFCPLYMQYCVNEIWRDYGKHRRVC
jgi:hypothetical protein